MKKLMIIAAALVSFTPVFRAVAEDPKPVAAAAEVVVAGEEPEAVPADETPIGPPPLPMTTSKIFAGGMHHSTVAKVNTGREFVGLTVPAKYWFKAAENGREITVYTDQARRNAVIFRFHTNSFPEFAHTTVWPLVSDHFDGVNPVMSQGSSMGRTALVFTAKTGTSSNPKHVRSVVVPCQAGSISVTAESYEAEADHAFFFMKQLTASLQTEQSEKAISGAVPTLTD
jgi:hypothetical protein